MIPDWLGQGVIAGFIQGLLEWLPVSSSGQVTLYYTAVAGVTGIQAYRMSLALHAATAIAAIVYYRRRLAGILRDLRGPLARMLAVSTAAALPAGYLVYRLAEGALRGPLDNVNLLVGLLLVVTGALLYVTGAGRGPGLGIEEAPLRLWVIAGIMEGIAVLPGLSRTGVTLAALLFGGMNPREAVDACFLMAIPVTLAAGLYEALTGGIPVHTGVALAAAAAALVAGLAGISFMRILASRMERKLAAFLVVQGGIVVALSIPALL